MHSVILSMFEKVQKKQKNNNKKQKKKRTKKWKAFAFNKKCVFYSHIHFNTFLCFSSMYNGTLE